MRSLLRRYVIVGLCVSITHAIIPSLTVVGNWQDILFAILVLTILLVIVKPIINLILLPINILTLNLSAWIVNIFVVALWVFLLKEVQLGAWESAGASFGAFKIASFAMPYWQTVIASGILLTLVHQLVSWIFS